jgi:hypothetical protein
MDNVQNCDSYINIPSSQTCRSRVISFTEVDTITNKSILWHMQLSSPATAHNFLQMNIMHIVAELWALVLQEGCYWNII